MLNTDMALAFPVITGETPGAPVSGYVNQICGPSSFGLSIPKDLNSGSYGCTDGANGLGKSNIKPSTLNLVNSYFFNNKLFLDSFARSFYKMVSVGYGRNNLGSLTNIDLTKC